MSTTVTSSVLKSSANRSARVAPKTRVGARRRPAAGKKAETREGLPEDRLNDKRLFLLLAETFQALGDASRVRIVWALSQGELCVGDLARAVEMSQPAVSHHLRTLRNLHLVRVRKEGRTAFYSIDDDHIGKLLREGIEHVEELLT